MCTQPARGMTLTLFQRKVIMQTINLKHLAFASSVFVDFFYKKFRNYQKILNFFFIYVAFQLFMAGDFKSDAAKHSRTGLSLPTRDLPLGGLLVPVALLCWAGVPRQMLQTHDSMNAQV